MDSGKLKTIIQGIVRDAAQLKENYTSEGEAPVNYVAVFSQSGEEYEDLLRAARELGQIIQDRPSGPVFKIDPLVTAAGELRILKIRRPDPARPERGAADFTLDNFLAFKENNLFRPEFMWASRGQGEMIELADPAFPALAFFSNPPLEKRFDF